MRNFFKLFVVFLLSHPVVAQQTIEHNKIYRMVALHSGKVADVSGGSNDNGANVHQYEYHDQYNQQWRAVSTGTQNGNQYWRFVCIKSNKVLEVKDYSNSNKANIQQWDWVGHDYQQWRVEDAGSGHFYVINKGSEKAMSVSNASTSNGANIWQFEKVFHNNQKWKFVLVPEPLWDQAVYKIVAAHSGKVAEVAGSSHLDGGAVIQWDYYGGANQQWRAARSIDNTFRFININSLKHLEVSNSSSANGAKIQQWTGDYVDNQKWRLRDAGDGYYYITNYATGKAMDVIDVSTANGAKIHQWQLVNGQNQKWKFERLPDVFNNNRSVTEDFSEESETSTKELTNSITVAPVPANTELKATFYSMHDKRVQVRLLNSQGNCSYSVSKEIKKGENTIVVDVPSSIRSGLYFISIENRTTKVIIQK
jgi:hypothetical protein